MPKTKEINPYAAKEADRVGKLPLHLSLRHCASKDVILQLLDHHPGAASVADEKGRLPLNYRTVMPKYAADGADEVALRLLALHPAAAKCSEEGTLPLHCALRARASPAGPPTRARASRCSRACIRTRSTRPLPRGRSRTAATSAC